MKKIIFILVLAFVGLFFFSCSNTKLINTSTKEVILHDTLAEGFSPDVTPTPSPSPMLDSPILKLDKLDSKKLKSSVTGLKAGFEDDNKQYNHFLNFLNEYKEKVKNISLDVSERVIIKVLDKNDKPILNAKVLVKDNNNILKEGLTYSDGSFLFFPSEYGIKNYNYNVTISYNDNEKRINISKESKKTQNVKLNISKTNKDIPIDILFIFDTTGSMGEEIARLKNTLELIYLNISNLNLKIKPRFGMVLYRDKNEEYVTKILPLRDDVKKFEEDLKKFVSASGGGDYPEDLQSALKESILNVKWNESGLKLAFIITDATTHLDYNQNYTYINAIKDASLKGIKIHSIGTGGLDVNGEYILRQIAQYTNGRYLFLTYGENGESEGGKDSSVSHHTGANYQTDKLEAVIIKFIKEEISNVLGKNINEDEYFEAKKIATETKEDTLKDLFNQSFMQLVDYSTQKIDINSTFSILPIQINGNRNLKLNAEYFSEQLLITARENKTLSIIERKDIQKILNELKLQDSGLVDEKTTVKLGKLMGAKYLLLSSLYEKNNKFELFIKLLNVENSEVLSITKIYIDKALGI